MAKKKSAYEKKLEYNNEYNRNNYRSFSIRYSIDNEKKIISWLEKQNGVKEYITGLIEADMEKNSRKAKTAAKKTTKASAKTKAKK